MPVYYVAHLKITDAELFKSVNERFSDVFKRSSGKVLAADSNFELLSGQFDGTRVVIIEFPSVEELKNCYNSSDYQETAKLREKAAEATILIAHGIT